MQKSLSSVAVVSGLIATATIGPWLVVVLLACGAFEIASRRQSRDTGRAAAIAPTPLLAIGALSAGTLVSLIWVALKVGALSYGGGFVIIPLMQSDAVNSYHWMTSGQFLTAVEGSDARPEPGAGKAQVALICCAYQRRCYRAVSSAKRCSFRTRRRNTTMTRRRFCRRAKLHRGLGQPAQRLIENTRLSALEIRRLLHCLDVEISLGELRPLGGDMLGVRMGVEKEGCEALRAAS